MHQLNFIEEGIGKAIVLLHGFCERKEVWTETMAELSSIGHVLAPDLPGFGDNPPLQQPVSVAEMAAQVYDWLQQQHIQEGIMIGHSLGGYIALALAEKHPEWLKGLGLFHSTALADTTEKKQKRTETIASLEKNGMETFAEPYIRGLLYQPEHPSIQPAFQRLVDYTLKTPVATAIAVTRAMRDRPDRTNVLRSADYPVLFIAGREDKAVTLASLQQQFFLPGTLVNIQILPETGHAGMFEKKEETLEALSAFVKQCKQEK